MTKDRRIDRLHSALSGRERAIMFLVAYKAGDTSNPENVAWFPGTDAQRVEYNRLIDILRFINNELDQIVMIVKEQVTQQELRLAYLQTTLIAADDLWLIGEYIEECVPAPVTASERAKTKKSPAAGFHVFADEDAAQVEELRKNRTLVGKLLRRGCPLELPLDISGEISLDPVGTEQTARLIAIMIRDGLASSWTQLQAIDLTAAKYAEDFRGEDPLRPQLRSDLNDALRRIVDSKDALVEFIGDWELPADHGDSIAAVTALADRILL